MRRLFIVLKAVLAEEILVMEENVPSTVGFSEGALSDGVLKVDLMDELLSVPGLDCSDLLQPGTSTSTSPLSFSGLSPLFEVSGASLNPILPENDDEVSRCKHRWKTPVFSSIKRIGYEESQP